MFCFFKLQKKPQDSLALIVYISSNLISTFQRALSLQMTWTISGATCSCTKPSGSTAPVSWWWTTTPPAFPPWRSTPMARRTSSSMTASCVMCPAGQQTYPLHVCIAPAESWGYEAAKTVKIWSVSSDLCVGVWQESRLYEADVDDVPHSPSNAPSSYGAVSVFATFRFQ